MSLPEFWSCHDGPLTLQLSFQNSFCVAISPATPPHPPPSRLFNSFPQLLQALQNLPLNPQGTPFQKQVWQALQSIPPGQTRSYRDVASLLGNPSAARAVGSAVAANPCLLAIPCHRILPASGKIGNFRWGTHLKSKLLSLESI